MQAAVSVKVAATHEFPLSETCTTFIDRGGWFNVMPVRAGFLMLALGLCAPVVAAGPATPSGTFYCCADANGKQACGDILPQECYGRAYREMGDGGRILRQVEAPLTAEQRARRATEEERRQAEEVARKEQQRKDQALLDTYGSERDIEAMRQRIREDVLKSIGSAESRIDAIRQQRKKLESEAEFYRKKPLPGDIRKGLRDADFEINAQLAIIEAKKKELDLVDARYEEDRRRYLQLRLRPASR